MSPRKFANLVDLFVLDYNFNVNSYEVISADPQNKSK